MDPLVIQLQDRRVAMADRLDLVGHGAAAVGLLAAAWAAMPARTAAGVALVAVEAAAAAALVAAIGRELRQRDEAPARVSWLNLIAAVVLLGEWYAAWSTGGKLVSPTLLSALTAGALGFLHPVIQRRRGERRMLRVDGTGITLRLGRFRRFSVAWSELRAVEALPDALRFARADGREQRVSLRMIRNRAEVADAVAAAAGRMLPRASSDPAVPVVVAGG